MASSKDKGNKSEHKVNEYFEGLLYLVAKHGKKVNWIFDKAKQTNRPVVGDVDLFGAFDLIAVRFDKKVTWIQVCSNHPQQIIDRKKKMAGLIHKFSPEFNRFLLFAYEGGRKTLDKRYKKEKRYLPWDYFNVYEITWSLKAIDKGAKGPMCPEHFREPSDDERYFEEENVFVMKWSEPQRLMCKPNLKATCWACGKVLEDSDNFDWNEDTVEDFELTCPDHEWAGNQWLAM